MNDVLLYSTGLDSYLARWYLETKGINVDCIYFKIGSRYSYPEMEIIQRLPFKVTIDDSIYLGDMERPDAYIPNRNILLATLASARYSDRIWIGGTLSDRVNDNNEKVFEELSTFLTKIQKKIVEVKSPFFQWYKTDIIKHYMKNAKCDVTAIRTLLNLTFSCYNPVQLRQKVACTRYRDYYYQTMECMKCPACFRKSVELNSIDVQRRFYNKELVDKYYKDFSNEITPTPRSKATLDYVKVLRQS